MLRRLSLLIFLANLLAMVSTTLAAQEAAPRDALRAATGGAQTLEDILARQRGEKIDDSFRRQAIGNPDGGAPITRPLGTLGGVSDPEIYRSLRYGTADVTVSARGPATAVLIQDGGMRWLEYRRGPLLKYGGFLLLAMIGALILFYLLRGKIRIEGEKTGQTVTRFKPVERFGHWLLGGAFILLGISGLITLMGRAFLMPVFGKEVFSGLALASKWVHNNVAWAFMAGLLVVIALWAKDNIPNKTDVQWIAKAGGLFSKGVHPPAKKFNAGQKVVFWSVFFLGLAISLTGLSLLFPFELPMAARIFQILNATGLPQLVGLGELQVVMTPQEEMQFAQLAHAIIAFAFIAIIIAHIYLGSVGMEGAYDAMGSGEVESQWAKEHHSLWYEDVMQAEPRDVRKTPNK